MRLFFCCLVQLFNTVIHIPKDLSAFPAEGRMLDQVKICSDRAKVLNSYCSADVVIKDVMNLCLQHQQRLCLLLMVYYSIFITNFNIL